MTTAAGTHHHVGLDWFKSSYSSDQGGACVEVAAAPGAVHVRDSKDPEGPILCVTPEAWASFLHFADEIA